MIRGKPDEYIQFFIFISPQTAAHTAGDFFLCTWLVPAEIDVDTKLCNGTKECLPSVAIHFCFPHVLYFNTL
jgi:hypothetical protein